MGATTFLVTIIFAIIAYIAFDLYQVISDGTIFDNPQSDFSICKRVPEIKGCEDLVIHHPSGYAFAGCPEDFTLHKNYLSLGYAPRTKLVLSSKSFFVAYNLKKQEPVVLNTKGFPSGVEFGIHGVDILQDPKDKNLIHLYAVNHRRGGKDSVEHFKHVIGSSEIEYVESFESSCLKLVNAVAAVTTNTFYYTQSHTHASGPLNYFESVGFTTGGKVMFYGGKEECLELASGYKFANGISLSSDKKLLYVAESYRARLHVFERDLEDNSEVVFKETVPLQFIPDNIKVEPSSGNIYIAGFSTDLKESSKLVNYDGELHKETFKGVAARVVNETGEGRFFGRNYKVEPILVDHGDTMFSSTVAAADPTTGSLLLSGLFTGRGMLDCRLQTLKKEL